MDKQTTPLFLGVVCLLLVGLKPTVVSGNVSTLFTALRLVYFCPKRTIRVTDTKLLLGAIVAYNKSSIVGGAIDICILELLTRKTSVHSEKYVSFPIVPYGERFLWLKPDPKELPQNAAISEQVNARTLQSEEFISEAAAPSVGPDDEPTLEHLQRNDTIDKEREQKSCRQEWRGRRRCTMWLVWRILGGSFLFLTVVIAAFKVLYRYNRNKKLNSEGEMRTSSSEAHQDLIAKKNKYTSVQSGEDEFFGIGGEFQSIDLNDDDDAINIELTTKRLGRHQA